MLGGKYLIVIGGPTAVGKTSTAIALAQNLACDIISADSRQFYQEMKIGTAKPNLDELSQAKHHFIDSLSIHEDYSVGKFETDAIDLLEKLFQDTDHCILTGGSGLYLNAISKGLDKFPQVAPSYRAALIAQMEQKGLASLVEELAVSDPVYFAKVDQQNPQRVIRALEIIRATQTPFSSYLRQSPVERPFKILLLQLTMDRPMLYSRINSRVDMMVEQGLKAEAKALYPSRSLNALRTVGYSEWFDFFEDKISESETIELIKRNTRRYAKRQITWFKNQGQYKPIPQDENAVANAISALEQLKQQS